MRTEALILVVGMALVTHIPRALPALFLEKLRFGPAVEKFLNLIPYTAMTALIFPGVLTVDAAHPVIGIAGGLTALLLAWRKCPLVVCMLSAIAVDFVLYLFI